LARATIVSGALATVLVLLALAAGHRALGADELSAPLSVQKHRIGSGKQTITGSKAVADPQR
jgi:hypothetical protein